jgi:hypothetical protein
MEQVTGHQETRHGATRRRCEHNRKGCHAVNEPSNNACGRTRQERQRDDEKRHSEEDEAGLAEISRCPHNINY